jgi:hypothetical protein
MADRPNIRLKNNVKVTYGRNQLNIGGVRKPKAPPSEFDKYKVAINNTSAR